MNNIDSAVRTPYRRAALAFCALLIFSSSFVFSGGPRDIGTHGAIRWDPAVVRYAIDRGNLGSLSNTEAANLVRQAFAEWQNVPTATIRFEDGGFLPVDVNSDNYTQFTRLRSEGNPVIFDSDGAIVEAIFGADSGRTVLGFANAVPDFFSDPQRITRYRYAYAVLNGKFATSTTFFQTVVHEIGHMLGLDHTQAGYEFAENFSTADNGFIPIMYPIVQRNGPQSPIRDDIAWISWLYPHSSFANTGTIRGQVFRRSGTPFMGANVAAVRVQGTTFDELPEETVSAVSDFMMDLDGSYELPGLQPGNYVLFIEPLDEFFVEGSGVGPYDSRSINFFKDYYGGPNESAFDDPSDRVLISVASGAVVSGIDVIANEPANRLDRLMDDDEVVFEFPDNFTFPFFGKTYREVVVNSDGNLTFGIGDGYPGLPRDQQRFLEGPPRIAPLFTDLNPEQGGAITATTEPGQVKFTWDGVPEFDGTAPGNRFSVTLFQNGDILFKYDRVSVTPDSDPDFPNQGLQAIVGITPGGAVQGSSESLAALGASVAVKDKPVFQVFPGTTFNLVGQELLFQVEAHDLYFPFYQGDPAHFTGFAISNLSQTDVSVVLEAFGPNGNRLPFPGNPHSETVGARRQIARLGSEFFEIPMTQAQNGWIRVRSSSPEIASSFQYGNGLVEPLSRMDGALAVREQSKLLFFTRVLEGASLQTPPGRTHQANTFLSIANPNDEGIGLRLELFRPDRQPLAIITRTLPPNGMLFGQVGELFGLPHLVGGFVRVEVTQGPGAVGFQLVRFQDSFFGLNASYGNPGNNLFSAQLANGAAGGVPVFTNLKLVNISNVLRAVTLTAHIQNPDGSVVPVTLAPITLSPEMSFENDLGAIFGLGSPEGAPTVGSLEVVADGPGVIGDVVFGHPVDVSYVSAMPLQTQGFTRAAFGQVSNGTIDPANPSLNTFTGLAFFNPNSQDANITIRVFDSQGQLRAQTASPIRLGPRQRFSELLTALLPATANLIGGHIVVESTRPLVGQEFFGNFVLTFVTAVPPTILQ
jgi:hypothetical protein